MYGLYGNLAVKSATSTHYLADEIPFLAYVIFSSNPTLR